MFGTPLVGAPACAGQIVVGSGEGDHGAADTGAVVPSPSAAVTRRRGALTLAPPLPPIRQPPCPIFPSGAYGIGNLFGQADGGERCEICAGEEGMREQRRMQEAIHAEHQGGHPNEPDHGEGEDVRRVAHGMQICPPIWSASPSRGRPCVQPGPAMSDAAPSAAPHQRRSIGSLKNASNYCIFRNQRASPIINSSTRSFPSILPRISSRSSICSSTRR